MRGRHLLAYALFLVACWVALAAWQRHEYGHERQLARQMLHRQTESVMNSLLGGIRSHRRLGYFFEEQLQVVLNELATSEDVLAVGVVSGDGRLALAAGRTDLLDTSPPVAPGEFWDAEGLRSVVDFHLDPESAGGPRGPGGGRGWGRGVGGQARRDDESPFSAGGDFTAVLLLDRTQTDASCRRAVWLHLWVGVAGGLVVLCAGLAWLATVRMVEARGRATLLETESRHLRDLSQAAAGLAHETRNPLGLIRGWTQRLAQSGLQSREQHEQARTVVEECDRVTARINQFLAFAKPIQPRLEAVDPDRLIHELAVLLEPDLEAKRLTLSHSLSKPTRTVQADSEMLRQALFNLLANAIQFAPESETVEISVGKRQDGDCRIEVADRGPGVPAEKVDSLFTPYFTTRPNGTGLGLAIVRRIAAAHGWQAGYTPRPGGGSVFWLDHLHG